MSFANNSRRNLSGIQKSLSRLQDSVLGTRKSAQSISKSLRESNIQKRKGIAGPLTPSGFIVILEDGSRIERGSLS